MSRSPSRSPQRSRSRSRSRSYSAERFSRFQNEEFRTLLSEQEKNLEDLVISHKKEIEELVQSDKTEKKILKKKALQKQFEFAEEIKKDLVKIKKCVKKKKSDKALDCLDSLIEKVQEKAEDIQIADSSPHGWLAVNLIRNKSNLPKDLQKKLDKVNSRLDRDRNNKRNNLGSGRYNQRQKNSSYYGRNTENNPGSNSTDRVRF